MSTPSRASATWCEPVLVRTLHPDDGYTCGVAGDCDEPAEWAVELAGLNSRQEEPEDDAPHADACMAHLGWVAGALLSTARSHEKGAVHDVPYDGRPHESEAGR